MKSQEKKTNFCKLNLDEKLQRWKVGLGLGSWVDLNTGLWKKLWEALWYATKLLRPTKILSQFPSIKATKWIVLLRPYMVTFTHLSIFTHIQHTYGYHMSRFSWIFPPFSRLCTWTIIHNLSGFFTLQLTDPNEFKKFCIQDSPTKYINFQAVNFKNQAVSDDKETPASYIIHWYMHTLVNENLSLWHKSPAIVISSDFTHPMQIW